MISAPSSELWSLSFRAIILMPLRASTTALDLCVAWSREISEGQRRTLPPRGLLIQRPLSSVRNQCVCSGI
jgi:hypothetical protein